MRRVEHHAVELHRALASGFERRDDALGDGDVLLKAEPVHGDHVAVAGTNRKLLVFPLAQLPVQARGKGVTLMRLKYAELADLKTLDAAQGLTWTANGKEGRERELTAWRGIRAGGGRQVPRGFPKTHRFS